MKNTLLILLLSLQIGLFQEANAQTTTANKKRNFYVGLGFGSAFTKVNFPNKTQHYIDAALDISIGYQLKPKLALLLSSNISLYNYEGYGRSRKRDFGILAPALQYNIGHGFWIMGGIGLGGDHPVFFDIKNPELDPLETKYFSGIGMVTSAGYEFHRTKNMSFDIKAKMSYRQVKMQEGKTNGASVALMLGINFK